MLLLGGIGPAPFCAMVLADLGAETVSIVRGNESGIADRSVDSGLDILGRGGSRIVLDLKDPADNAVASTLAADADIVIEGFRPGVAERLGFGPQRLTEANPRLVYVRVTGYGQDGPLAHRAGHDINFIAKTGLLHAVGRRGGPPQLPLNVVGDYGGGGLLAALGACAALWERDRSGHGQVVDAAMVDGVALLMASLWEKRSNGHWSDERGTNALDSGAAAYDVYETSDGKWMAVGSREPVFFEHLVHCLGLDREAVRGDDQELRKSLEGCFRTRTQAEWVEVFGQVDACVSPVQSLSETAADASLRERGTYLERGGHVEPAPAPRFSRTPSPRPREPRQVGTDWRWPD